MKKILLTLSLCGAVALTVFAENRTWTQASTGKKLEGEFVKMKDDKTAIIKMRGVDRDVPLAMLSEDDQKFIAEKIAPPKPDGDAPKTEAAKKGSAPKSAAKSMIPPGPISVTLSEVHLCCRDAEERAELSKDNEKITFTDIENVKIEPNKSEGTIKVSANSGKDAMTALKGLMAAGFYGTSSHGSVKIADLTKGDFEATTMTVKDLHICCGKCLSTVKKTLKEFEGIDDHTAKQGGSSFVVRGESFKPKEVMDAFRAKGLGGSYQ